MKPLYLTAAFAAAVLLSACGQKGATNDTAASEPNATNAAANMGNMAMPAEAKIGKGTGTVTAIDKSAGKITLSHGPIPEVGWPAMTMTFAAKPELLSSVAVGDKVAFDVTVKGTAGEVTAITKQ
ncbi:Cu and Ag efflux protein CusF [Sphingobium sp. AP50]|uniref:copper-binding protein n=1 Tax=Sphingobium sp. AP50 TaxID=1884369 RepID=UPI0008C460F7|nr:copper-binding protein [Sphingobium sp. AP50]SEI96195.1 Cu and Ag efflux protein CusF [Sphingobium sp. AP50]